MDRLVPVLVVLALACPLLVRAGATASGAAEEILSLERAALERWCNGDPSGFLEISDADVVYFDPFVERRLDGLEALTRLYESFRGQVRAERWEMLAPRVDVIGDAAVLTFNFEAEGGGRVHRWNCTEVYRRGPAGWRIIQTHWSLTKPALAPEP